MAYYTFHMILRTVNSTNLTNGLPSIHFETGVPKLKYIFCSFGNKI